VECGLARRVLVMIPRLDGDGSIRNSLKDMEILIYQ